MIEKVAGFDWDEANTDKCQRHGVTVEMIETFFEGEIHVLGDVEHSTREERLIAVGRAPSGRAIFVGFTYRISRKGLLIRPITARFMHKREFERYEKAFTKT